MKTKQTSRIPFYIVLFVTLLVSVIYIIVAMKQEKAPNELPAPAAAGPEEPAYMQHIREHREQYDVTCIPWDKKLTFTLHIAPESLEVGKVLYEDDYGTISVGDLSLDNDQWRIYFDFTGKGDANTFTLLSLDADDNYPTTIEEVAGTSSSSSGAAAIEDLTEEELSDDWRVKISYPYAGTTSEHEEYWNSEDLLPDGERIGYNIFYSDDEMDAAEEAGGIDVTFTMKELKRLTWKARASASF